MNTSSTLAAIMDDWNGQQLQIKVQGNRTIVRSPHQNKHNQNVHNYRTLQERNQNNYHPVPLSHQHMKQNLQGGSKFYSQQFTVRARSKSPNERISLADLGELYSQNQSRIQPNKSNIKTRQQFHNQNEGRIQSNRSPRNTVVGQGKNIRRDSRKFVEENRNEPQRENGGWIGSKRKRSNEMKQIMESINEIKLPQSQKFCPMYNQANIQFEQMKCEILHKILTSGQQDEMEDILKQIKMAADRIIAKHCPSALGQLNCKHFSFKDDAKQNQLLNLNEAQQEQQDKSLYINLPLFKDDAGSISSIMSKDDIRKDESKEEDVAKIQNIFISDAHHKGDKILASLGASDNEVPIVIEGLKATMKKEWAGQNKQSRKNSLLPKQIGHQREEMKVEVPKINTLHFVRKEEVVKCLMAAHVVERQSASIEF